MIYCWLFSVILPRLNSCNLFNDYCDTMEDMCGPVSESRQYFDSSRYQRPLMEKEIETDYSHNIEY